MEDLNNNLNTSTTIVKDCLIITLPNDIIDDEIEKGFDVILTIIEKSPVKGVILNLSMISSLDRYFFKALERISKTILLMGPRVVWVGLRPGVVSALIDLNIDVTKIKAACDLEQGISIILNNNYGF
jgi:rsbT antagonist protein RsbS